MKNLHIYNSFDFTGVMPKTLTIQLFQCLVLDAKGQNVSELKQIPVQRAAFASGRRNVCVCVCALLCVPEPARQEPYNKN